MPPFNSYTIFSVFLLLHFSQTTGVNFTIVNKCSETIWPAVLSKDTGLSTGEVQLSQNRSFEYQTSNLWSGRFWGKTGCSFENSVYVSCRTGDCGSTGICRATGVTLIEFTLGTNMDFYDVSLVNGYNLPVMVQPVGGSGQCRPTGCPNDLILKCPQELRMIGGACGSACDVLNTTEYCCTGEYNSPDKCRPSNYSQVFQQVCPNAYSYAYDNASKIHVCSKADYVITFCPDYHSWLQSISPVQTPAYPPAYAGEDNPSTGYGSPGGSSAAAKNYSMFTIVVAIDIIAVLVITSIVMYCFVKRLHLKPPWKKSRQDIEKILAQHGSLTPKRYTYSQIKKITKSFSDKLGQGGYGSVYKGTLRNGSPVAVKVLTETDSSDGEEFINEVISISRTSHVNIVSLLGFCYEGNRRALVYEYMPNKSLDKFLCNKGLDRTTLDLQKLYEIAVGIAKGLEYLHTGCTTRIVHFDIKPQNILLDEDMCPKISDFGLAKLCKKKQSVLSNIGTRGTIGYIAPEMISRNFGGVSHKSDVYSYGMMILEMAGAREYEEEVEESRTNYFPDRLYQQVTFEISSKLDDLRDEEGVEETRKKMLLIGFWCIQTAPSDRPSMSKVVEMLERNLESIEIPPKPFQFSATTSHHQTSTSCSTYLETENSALD